MHGVSRLQRYKTFPRHENISLDVMLYRVIFISVDIIHNIYYVVLL
jgi:hypothetical protein